MQSLKLTFTGSSPLLLHSDRGANPLDPETIAHKTLTSKRKKTDEDHLAIARSEYMLGFYPGDDIVIPGTNIKTSLIEGAKFNKLGASFKRTVMLNDEFIEIQHDNPKTKEAMWNSPICVDCRSVKVSTSRLMRYRPRFNKWSVKFELFFDERMVERGQIITAAENAGQFIGLGDYRPACGGVFGRFTVTESKK